MHLTYLSIEKDAIENYTEDKEKWETPSEEFGQFKRITISNNPLGIPDIDYLKWIPNAMGKEKKNYPISIETDNPLLEPLLVHDNGTLYYRYDDYQHFKKVKKVKKGGKRKSKKSKKSKKRNYSNKNH